MERTEAYIPMNRRQALAQGQTLTERTEGAALFADISGFTPLTAALLQELGLKRGSEELPRQLNLVYDALINEVHRFQGSVISFSGDAITCWLDGDDGTQATACALALQAAMRQFEAITTPAGTIISLGLKVAVVTGPIRRFVVGDENIQLMDSMAGATLERMAEAEGQAERGDVIVGPEVVEAIGDKLTIAEYRTDEESGIQYAQVTGLTEEVTPTPWPELTEDLPEDQVRPWLLPPVYERLTGGAGEFLAEIRPSVALFLRFGGIDYDTDPEAGTKLNDYVRWVQSVLIKYESYMLQLTIGDKGCYLYSSFGSPQLHDDDPARAVAAALELQSPPDELDYIGPVQIGISQGRMRSGAYGGQARRTYGSLGDEVNMSARLMGKAEPGQIMVSQRVADAVVDLYELEDLGRIKVKGKEEPIPVASVLGRLTQARPRAVNLFPTPLVGRDEELAQMEQIIATAEASQSGQILRIEGVAGIGKSHLTAEFAQQSTMLGWRVVLGTCHSINQSIPYHPWQQIFRALFALVGDDTEQNIEYVRLNVEALNPDWLVRLPLLGDLLDLPIPDNATTAAFEPQLRQEALFTFAIDLLQSWTQVQPLLLLIEDVHWLDEASRGLIIALSRVVSQSTLVLTVIQRPPLDTAHPILPELDQQVNYHFMDLDELNPEGVTAVIANRIGGEPTPLLIDLIVVQARGNPFFVEEMTDTLREAGHLAQEDDGRWTLSDTLVEALRRANCLTRDESGQLTLNPDIPLSAADLGLPDSIQQVVLSRLDRLLEDQRLTLKVASVIGRVFEFQLLADAHPLEDDDEQLLQQVEIIERREFARLEIPLPTLTHLFKHNITRDVAYETLLESQQRDLHRAVGEAVEEHFPEAVEQLAYHFTRGRVRDKAMLYLGQAAQKAQREYANETALAFYEQALALEPRWEWLKGQIEVLHLLGRREEELAALERLQAIPDAPPFEVAYLWGQYYEAIADYPQAQAAIERALTAARSDRNTLGEIRSLGQLGLIARRQGDYAGARGRYEEALVNFDAQREYSVEEAHIFAQVLNGVGIVHRQQGEFDAAKDYYTQSLSLSRGLKNQRNEAEALNSLGVNEMYKRNFLEAIIYHQEALGIRQNIGDRAGEGISLFNLAQANSDLGDYERAHQYFLEAQRIHQATGNRWEEVNILMGLGVLQQELGDWELAERYLNQGIDLANTIGDAVGVAYLLDNLGLVKFYNQTFEEAEKLFSDGLEIAQSHDEKHLIANIQYHLGLIFLNQGNLADAISNSMASLNLRRELGIEVNITGNLSVVALAQSRDSDITASIENATEAFTILDNCKGVGPEFPQIDYLYCYQVFNTANREIHAQEALRLAYNLIISRAEKISDPTLRQSFLTNIPINQEIIATYQEANQ